MSDWPPWKRPADVGYGSTKTGRPDLLDHYREVLAERWGRPVSRRTALDAALLVVRATEQRGVLTAGNEVRDAVHIPTGRAGHRKADQ